MLKVNFDFYLFGITRCASLRSLAIKSKENRYLIANCSSESLLALISSKIVGLFISNITPVKSEFKITIDNA